MNIAQEVSSMETELVSLRTEIDIRRQHEAVLENENEAQRKMIVRLQSDRDTAMRRAEAIKVLLDQCGSSLVNGIQKFHATEREFQEKDLGIGRDDPPPQFLSTAERVLGHVAPR